MLTSICTLCSQIYELNDSKWHRGLEEEVVDFFIHKMGKIPHYDPPVRDVHDYLDFLENSENIVIDINPMYTYKKMQATLEKSGGKRKQSKLRR